MSRRPNPVLSSVEKYELCKSRMNRRFLSVFKKTSNSKKAYEEAIQVIDGFVARRLITNVKQVAGLKAARAINGNFNDIALFFRKLSGLTISAIVDTSTEMIGNKDNIQDVTKQFWVHPHRYIRKNLGQQGETMDYDVAARALASSDIYKEKGEFAGDISKMADSNDQSIHVIDQNST